MWTAGYKYSWRKMETAAQNSAEDAEEWSVDYVLQQRQSQVHT